MIDLDGNPIPDDWCPVHLARYGDDGECHLCTPHPSKESSR